MPRIGAAALLGLVFQTGSTILLGQTQSAQSYFGCRVSRALHKE